MSKNFIKGVLIILIAVVIHTGCMKSKIFSSDDTGQENTTTERTGSIGEIHNAGLDYFINELANYPDNSFSNASEIIKYANDTIIDFCIENVSGAGDALENQELQSFIESTDKPDLNQAINYCNIGGEFDDYLIELDIVISTEPFATMSSKIQDLTSEVKLDSMMNTNDKAILLNALSVAYSSSNYWQKDLSLWINSIADTTGELRPSDTNLPDTQIRDIVATDIAAFLVTGIIGAATGGIGAGVTAGLIGGTSASAIIGIVLVINHYFPNLW